MSNTTASRAGCTGFNEAEAFTPRIRVQGGTERDLTYPASMRPRLLHLGYAVCAAAAAGLGVASMRPRLLHLGYRRFGVGEILIGVASMRPRLLHLGYRAIWISGCIAASRFNEAEAFTPRILRFLCADSWLSQTRFNEAEAFTPRIHDPDEPQKFHEHMLQ